MRKSILCLMSALPLAACDSQPDYRAAPEPPATVASVDLERYQGLWYEIARYPNSFEENCAGVTAEYTLLEDGDIRVVNTCHIGRPNGPAETSEGRAWATDETNAKLKVRFAPSWIPFAAGDYWILKLADDYSTALVGDPAGKYLWILAREPEISGEVLNDFENRAMALGYDVSKLELTEH